MAGLGRGCESCSSTNRSPLPPPGPGGGLADIDYYHIRTDITLDSTPFIGEGIGWGALWDRNFRGTIYGAEIGRGAPGDHGGGPARGGLARQAAGRHGGPGRRYVLCD